ncbi:hypothetical protein [Bacillus fonticola]|uniref:hypothetical protein n=1 Tax=Bacillus fonticola TaxID=2728853 RepID=UPI001D15A361|nr:hypothetical protein [Bacillus fonticola]
MKSETSPFSFKSIIPIGDENKSISKTYSVWGTKWDVREVLVESNGRGGIGIAFETAYSPVPKVIEVLAKKFPQAKFSYEALVTSL